MWVNWQLNKSFWQRFTCTTDTIEPSEILQSESNEKDGKNQGNSAQNVVQSFECETCNASFSKKSKLNMHVTLAHKGKTFECKLCEKSFSRKAYLKKHVESVHEEKKRPLGKKTYKCELCGKSFSQKGDLKRHIASVHEGKKPYECDLCE